jgi:hypothetical protein
MIVLLSIGMLSIGKYDCIIVDWHVVDWHVVEPPFNKLHKIDTCHTMFVAIMPITIMP